MDKLRILHLEDDSNDAFFVRRALEKAGFDVEIVAASSRDEFLEAIDDDGLDAILVDQGLPGFSGSSALEIARERRPKLPFIIVSGSDDPHRIASSLKAGAADYVLKNQLWRLPGAIRRFQRGGETPGRAADLESRVKALTSQLDAANRELDAFSYSILHDLRAPLRTIAGFAQLVADELAQPGGGNARPYLENIKSESRRMSILLGELAHLAKLARVELNPERVDLSAMAGELADGLRTDSRRKARFSIQSGLVAEADPGLLRIALGQLFSNAWKFTESRDEALIEMGSVTHPDGGLAYFVRDNGVGFDPKHAIHLFAPFQRMHRSDEYPGVGIGLAVVQRIIHRHGGRVWADSAENRGATFLFTLAPEAARPALGSDGNA